MPASTRVQRFLDQRLGVHVECGERVVEHEHPRPADDGPGEREPLALAARERQPLLADPGVETPRQVVGELGLGDLEGVVTSSSVASGRAERDVLADAGRENRVGSSKADRHGAQRVQPEVADVVAVERCPPAGDVVERGTSEVSVVLPEPVAPTQREPSRPARTSRSTSWSTGLVRTRILVERDALEPQAPDPLGRAGVRPVDDGDGGVEHLVDALGGAGSRPAGVGQDPAERVERPGDERQAPDERHQLPDRHRTASHRVSTAQQPDAEHQPGHDFQGGPEEGDQAALLPAGGRGSRRRRARTAG